MYEKEFPQSAKRDARQYLRQLSKQEYYEWFKSATSFNFKWAKTYFK